MTTQPSILLCEDDESLGMLLSEYLQEKGFRVDLMTDGEAGLKAFISGKYDLCVLDVMMPKKDGFTLAQEIRSMNSTTGIIFLTARNTKEDVLEGLKIGADDYVSKPFSMEELILRIQAVLRRVKGADKKEQIIFHVGNFTFDKQKQTLSIGEKVTDLTTKENDLLGMLVEHKNTLLERRYTLTTIWLEETLYNARSMDVYINRLRKLLKDDPQVEILNIHGKGYKLIAPETEENVD